MTVVENIKERLAVSLDLLILWHQSYNISLAY
jgi:hypothetical protein